MPRLMSVALTQPQVVARSKTVTRRLGWLMLKPGDHLTLCKKVQGRLKGEPLERITDVEVVSVRRERLDAITPAEVVAEGFPDMTPSEFVEFFCASHKGCEPGSEVTRVEWRYLDNDICEMDGTQEDTYGGEHYWHCGKPAALTVDGMRLCLDHAGERGHGPLQEDYGFDPDDGLNPDQEVTSGA